MSRARVLSGSLDELADNRAAAVRALARSLTAQAHGPAASAPATVADDDCERGVQSPRAAIGAEAVERIAPTPHALAHEVVPGAGDMDPRDVPRAPDRRFGSVRRAHTALAALVVLAAPLAFAGNRARPGGTLQVALVAPAPAVEPLTADAPVDALRLLLTHQLLCRVVEPSRPAPGTLRLTLLPSVEPKLVTDALQRVAGSTAPARALLAPVASWAITNGRAVDLTLKSPAPDLERALCHPAFAVATGPFRAKGGRLEAFEDQPTGRPHLDALVLQAADARTAERLFAQRRVQFVAGDASSDDGPQLFVTALVIGPGGGALKQAVESTTDRADLARFFVPGPAAGLTGLLPAALAPPPAPLVVARPAPLSPPRELTILFDEEAAHERSIAQRLQVKLQPLGYRLALKATPRAQLRGRAPAEGEVVVQSFALPPTAVGALSVWLELAGQRARLPSLLQQLAAAPELEVRARELATQLGAELPIVPLVTRGLGVTAAREVQHLTRDVLGLPRLDDVFLSAE